MNKLQGHQRVLFCVTKGAVCGGVSDQVSKKPASAGVCVAVRVIMCVGDEATKAPGSAVLCY